MIILQDTRERTPWDFTFYGYEQVIQTLQTGDYTLKGYEKLCCIERKRTSGEIAVNLGVKKAPFMKEIARMQEFEHRYIICEFSEDTLMKFPYEAGIPKSMIPRIRISKNYISSCLKNFNDELGINVIFCNSVADAEMTAIGIFREIVNGTDIRRSKS